MPITKQRRDGSPARRKRITYANVVSTLALFFVLAGGSAYAASHYIITKKSQIKPSVLAQLKGNTGSTGPSGISNYDVVSSGAVASVNGAQNAATATCPDGDSVLGGGVVDAGTSVDDNVNASYPLPGNNGWHGYVNNSSGSATTFTVIAICATVSGS